MRKLLFFLLAVSGIAKAQIVNIPDLNFKSKLVASTIDANHDGEIQYTEAENVINLSLQNSNISDLTGIEAFVGLHKLDCHNNQLTTIDLSTLVQLTELICGGNQFTALDFSALTQLKTLSCGANQLHDLDVTPLLNLENLYCHTNYLTSLNVAPLVNLKRLSCSNTMITELNVAPLSNLEMLDCTNAALTELDVTPLINLTELYCGQNSITSLNVLPLVNLQTLRCEYNQITELDVTNLTNLAYLYTASNHLATLDLSTLIHLNSLECNGNDLTMLNIKNGAIENNYSMHDNPLQFVCADEAQLATLQQFFTYYNGLHPNLNSYCSFTPGGNYNTITGNLHVDHDNNGCDATDVQAKFMKVNISGTTGNGVGYSNDEGKYVFYTQQGNFTITPEFQNSDFFTITPESAIISFTDNNNNIQAQDFCITANGVSPDVEVVIVPVIAARPGFEAVYEIFFKNKGNHTLSGNIDFVFNDYLTDFISASVEPDSVSPNHVLFSYNGLVPFEYRSIMVTLGVNAPTDTPAVNINDQLDFTASITPVIDDITSTDNVFAYKQIVVGSLDPNDISCLEGQTVSPDEIGNYLHYVINFENTGTAAAENIVVKEIINPAKFDVASLQVLNASHDFTATVYNNVLEIKFANIQLGASQHGRILLKIKSKDNLVAGNSVAKQANIYFDYNFPVLTNTATTVFSTLSTGDTIKDNSLSIYPNPAADVIYIDALTEIKSMELFDAQGRLLLVKANLDAKTGIDVSKYNSGIYYIRVATDKGIKTEKIIKK